MKSKKKWFVCFAVLFVLCLLSAWGFSLKRIDYKVDSEKLDSELKIVFISDFHNCFYGGTDQSGIWNEIKSAEPDIVLFGGDVIDMCGGTSNSLKLMEMVNSEYPCAYAPGNHEAMRSDTEQFYADVEKIGIIVLHGDNKTIEVNGINISIFGVDDILAWYGNGMSQIERCISDIDDSNYNILLLHQPEQYKDVLDECGEKYFDLILSGHAHGGQWRLPYVLEQGLYAPDQGVLPDYTTGMYFYDKTTHIISRGLARPLRMIFIPRIFNRPELSVIEIS